MLVSVNILQEYYPAHMSCHCDVHVQFSYVRGRIYYTPRCKFTKLPHLKKAVYGHSVISAKVHLKVVHQQAWEVVRFTTFTTPEGILLPHLSHSIMPT